MTDRLKHQLYDTFLKDTPIQFESVTDQQWASMQSTVIGFGLTLRSIYEDFSKAISDIFEGVKK